MAMPDGRFAHVARRSVSLPISPSQSVHPSSSQNAQPLFRHIATVFSLSRPVPVASVLAGEIRDWSLRAPGLPWTSAHDKLLASGRMEISSRPDFPPFITIGSVFFKPILRNTQCWSVDGSAKFVLSGQSPTSFLRLEMPLSTELDIIKLKSFTNILASLCQFETTACPFVRAFNPAVPPRVEVSKKPWSPKAVISASERVHSSSITTTTIELGQNDLTGSSRSWSKNQHPFTAPLLTNHAGMKPLSAAQPRHKFRLDEESTENKSRSKLQMKPTISSMDPEVKILSEPDSVDSLGEGHVQLCETPLREHLPSIEIENSEQQRHDRSATSTGQESIDDCAQEDVNIVRFPRKLPGSIELDNQAKSSLPASNLAWSDCTQSFSGIVDLKSPKHTTAEEDHGLHYRRKTKEPVSVGQMRRLPRTSADSESLLYLLWTTLLVLFLRCLVQIKTRVESIAPMLRTHGPANDSSDEDLQPSPPGRWITRNSETETDGPTTEDTSAMPPGDH